MWTVSPQSRRAEGRGEEAVVSLLRETRAGSLTSYPGRKSSFTQSVNLKHI